MRPAPFLGDADRSNLARGDSMTEDQLLAELGRLYYLEDVSKVDLGRRFDLSRFKIARMLAKGGSGGSSGSRSMNPPRIFPSSRAH